MDPMAAFEGSERGNGGNSGVLNPLPQSLAGSGGDGLRHFRGGAGGSRVMFLFWGYVLRGEMEPSGSDCRDTMPAKRPSAF